MKTFTFGMLFLLALSFQAFTAGAGNDARGEEPSDQVKENIVCSKLA